MLVLEHETFVHNYSNLCLFKFQCVQLILKYILLSLELGFKICFIVRRGACLSWRGWAENLAGAVFIIQAPLIGYFVAV